mgnify:CR=1 FL=1
MSIVITEHAQQRAREQLVLSYNRPALQPPLRTSHEHPLRVPHCIEHNQIDAAVSALWRAWGAMLALTALIAVF